MFRSEPSTIFTTLRPVPSSQQYFPLFYVLSLVVPKVSKPYCPVPSVTGHERRWDHASIRPPPLTLNRFKNWKWRFQLLRRRVRPGKPANRPRFLEVPPAITREASNATCHFFRVSFWKIVDTAVQFPPNQFSTKVVGKKDPFSDETQISSPTKKKT